MIDQIRPNALAAWFESQGGDTPLGPVVLDVREPWELQTASVSASGFELVTIPMSQLQARMGELNPKRPTAILCHHGNRSQRVAMFLAGNGFDRVANIAGGIEAWSGEIDPAIPRY